MFTQWRLPVSVLCVLVCADWFLGVDVLVCADWFLGVDVSVC